MSRDRHILTSSPVRVLLVWCPQWPIVAARAAHDIGHDVELALVDKGFITDCSAAAEREGVVPGLRLRQAQHRCPDLVVLPRDPDLDRRTFEPVLHAVEDVVPGVHVVRPGVAAVRAQGPSRFYGSDQAAARTLWEGVSTHVDYDLRLAVADGLFAAEQAARTTTAAEPVAIIAPGASPDFLAPLPVATVTTDLGHARLGNLLRRLGIRTLGELAALPAADVHARFGDSGIHAHQLSSGFDVPSLSPREIPTDLTATASFDPSAEHAEQVIAACEPQVAQLLDRLDQNALVCTAVRITIHTSAAPIERLWRHPWHFVGSDILDRLRWQLGDLGASTSTTLRADEGGRTHDVTAVHLALEHVVQAHHQAEGLWGARPDEHVIHAITTVQHRLGQDGVLAASLGGGRLLDERRLLRPWGEPAPNTAQRRTDQPWPGSLPGPAPARVFHTAHGVRLLSEAGDPLTITPRGDLSSPPTWFAPSPPDSRKVLAWAGPWPVRQRWWRRGPAYDRVQLVDEHQQAWLLLHHSGQWWAEARYD